MHLCFLVAFPLQHNQRVSLQVKPRIQIHAPRTHPLSFLPLSLSLENALHTAHLILLYIQSQLEFVSIVIYPFWVRIQSLSLMADFKNQADQEPSPQDGEDYFDLLPDPILLLIFNKLLDAKSLCRCLLVSKQFASLVPQIDSVSIQVNHALKPSKNSRTGSKSNFFKGFVSKFVAKPIQFLHQIMGKKVSSSSSKDGRVEVVQWSRRGEERQGAERRRGGADEQRGSRADEVGFLFL